MKNRFYLFILLFSIVFIPNIAKAWECYIDPIYERDLWGKYNIAAYVLESECSGTAKLETVPAGAILHIIAETDGWYKVETNNGNIGWTGAQLITLVNEPTAQAVVISETELNTCEYGNISNLEKQGRIKNLANIRNNPCLDASIVLEQMQAGTIVGLTGKIDGWYQIERFAGEKAWVVDWLLDIVEEDQVAIIEPVTNITESFRDRTKGQLLLQVQQHGEIWYVDPIKFERYHATVENALPLFRKLSLGITNTDLSNISMVGSDVASDLGLRLKGRLLLAVEDLGRVWYVDLNGFRREVREENIMTLFRSLGLGITDADLGNIAPGNLAGFGNDEFPEIAPENNISILPLDYSIWYQPLKEQRGTVPSSINLQEANFYWLSEINKLRSAANLRELKMDTRFVETATEWAGYMGADLGYTTHTRADGKSMHQWIDTKNLDWTERYSESNGWVNNYFTENIAWNYIEGTTEGLKKAIDYTIDWILAEASYNGDHYRTIYHSDWNTVGCGFYFKDLGNGSYHVFIAMHYGSLK